MRHDFVQQTLREMERNKNIVFLTGDLGFRALEPIQTRFPDRFHNVGIAEANMIGMAAGLALMGKKVIAYSISTFLTMRPYEQIRTDICYDNLDVKLFGTGGGFNYPTHGITHHSVEDIAIMSVLPNMKVVCPAYSWEAREATRALLRNSGPSYMRLSKAPSSTYEKKDWQFEIGKGYAVRPGTDVVLISTGNILDMVMETAKLLEQKIKKKIGVISMPTVKPLDEELVLKLAKKARAIFTIEEHSIIGGLGSAIGMVLAQSGARTVFRAFGIPDRYIKDVGDRKYLLTKCGLSPELLVSQIFQTIKHSRVSGKAFFKI